MIEMQDSAPLRPDLEPIVQPDPLGSAAPVPPPADEELEVQPQGGLTYQGGRVPREHDTSDHYDDGVTATRSLFDCEEKARKLYADVEKFSRLLSSRHATARAGVAFGGDRGRMYLDLRKIISKLHPHVNQETLPETVRTVLNQKIDEARDKIFSVGWFSSYGFYVCIATCCEMEKYKAWVKAERTLRVSMKQVEDGEISQSDLKCLDIVIWNNYLNLADAIHSVPTHSDSSEDDTDAPAHPSPNN